MVPLRQSILKFGAIATTSVIGLVLVSLASKNSLIALSTVPIQHNRHGLLDLRLHHNSGPNPVDHNGDHGVLVSNSRVVNAPPALHLPEIPPSLTWAPVSLAERQSTPTCPSNPDPRLIHCCIGQCRQKHIKIDEGTPAFDALFVKPDMSDLANMMDMLEVLHRFVDQKRVERQQQRAESQLQSSELPLPVDIDTCAMWFVGDSLTSDLASAAFCQLVSLGYELSPTRCDINSRGLLEGSCELTHPNPVQQQYCPKVRLRMGTCNKGRVTLGRTDITATLDEAGPIILNHGVHENSREDFKNWMERYFYRAYNRLTKNVPESSRYRFMWREHEPQHFQTEGAVWGGVRTECGQPPPYEDGSPGLYDNYRNEEAYNFFVREGLVPNAVHVVKSYDAHKPVHAFHFPGDCTHYCYTPWRFDLTWHGIAMGLLQTPKMQNYEPQSQLEHRLGLGQGLVGHAEGPLTAEEHNLFLEGLRAYGRGERTWDMISKSYVTTRSSETIRKYAKEYFIEKGIY